MSDDTREKGRFTERPPGAAPLFDPESGRKAALKRWEDQKARNQQALINAVAARLDIDPEKLDYETALKDGLLVPMFVEAMVNRKTAAIKLCLQMLGEMPEGADAKVVVDKRQVKFMNFNFTPERARTYIADQRARGNEEVALLVESQMNWETEEDEITIIQVPIND